MDFFQHHFRRQPKRGKPPPGPPVQTSKARRRSSVGLSSAALADFRRTSVGLPPVCADQHRRPSVGMLVASGEKRQSIIELKTSEAAFKSGRVVEQADVKRRRRRGFQCGLHAGAAVETAPCVHRRPALRHKCPKAKFIEPHLLGSSMLLASVVQMGRGVKEKEDEDASLSSCSDSTESDEELESTTVDVKDLTHIPPPVFIKKVRPCLLLRPPRCLRKNSSHLLPAGSVFGSSETEYGPYGRYSRRRSSQSRYTVNNNAIQASPTSPSLCQLSSTAGAGAGVAGSGSPLQKSCWPTPRHSEEVTYYDPYLDTWENFLSYVKYNTHTLVLFSL